MPLAFWAPEQMSRVIAAVLDWEMSTLGDPLTDLAHLLVYWEPSCGRVTHESQAIAEHPGFLGSSELAERYATADVQVMPPRQAVLDVLRGAAGKFFLKLLYPVQYRGQRQKIVAAGKPDRGEFKRYPLRYRPPDRFLGIH